MGLAGGPIVIGILIGAYGPRLHLVTYTTRSANLMLRGIGLSLYLACLGLDAGAHFFETVMRPEGALWVGIGFLITFIPVVIMALVSLRLCKMDFGNTCGMLCGSMANPMALNYANDIIPGDEPSVSYATVYPLGMFTRVIIAQLVLMYYFIETFKSLDIMKTYKQITPEMIQKDIRYLELLSHDFPNLAAASTEIINLEAILNLPKGTEHFLADLHGEYEAFQHVLRNASGAIKRKVNEISATTSAKWRKGTLHADILSGAEVTTGKGSGKDLVDWYVITLNQLVKVCQNVSSKYTRSKVRKALPEEFSYIIQELLHESPMDPNKQAYINVIIRTIIDTRRADDFIIALCNLIQRLTIDSLHILGDIFDRGPGPHIIMDTLCDYHNFDIQWGNHDILWMGAASGNDCCIANVLRLAMRYGNLPALEDGYGINLLPLATFAMEAYANDPCEYFAPKIAPKAVHTMTRPCGSSHRCTRPSPLSSLSWKLLPSDVIRNLTWTAVCCCTTLTSSGKYSS